MELKVKVHTGKKMAVKKLLDFLDVDYKEHWDLDIDKYIVDIEVDSKDIKALSSLIKEVNYI